jgi:dolichyl-diphosphooligosaccharide--protein glycosyltransferase
MSNGGELNDLVDLVLKNPVTRVIQGTGRKWSPVLEKTVLLLTCFVCFFIRLFAVIRYESVIHEFDPYFNYRTTKYLSHEGFYEFWNWFDEGSWYPLGRVIGQTLYPGLMTTSAIFYYVLNYLGICLDIRNVCVFIAPIFSAFTALAAYLLTKEVTDGRSEAGLLAALFLGA